MKKALQRDFSTYAQRQLDLTTFLFTQFELGNSSNKINFIDEKSIANTRL